ncbi:hypothetical protein CASFOL_031271 [Castilleja foliolosa]|uniref:RRM domain-containing protein n=1 Tax=Castilleja foliolosa TaxID=1961234 RepID=A0ABD3C547_9LAMI
MEGDNRTFRVNNFTSDGVKRLRENINEKLKEFMGDYTDDTLVEYVIVLLKNGRSKVEAKSELNVFLGDDSDSFVSWLWDHLGSNLSLYVHPQELLDGAPKTKLTAGDEAEKIESHQIASEAEKGNSVKAQRLNNRQPKGLVRDGVEDEVPLTQNSIADIEVSQDEPPRRVVRTKPSLSPRPTIHKKTRRNEEQQPRKRPVSQSTVSAPRRLLQFAVRDAVATSRPSNVTAEPSRKRLRSVVSTSTGDLLQEEGPQRTRRTSMSAAIKAAAEAVMDVTKFRPSHNVFDRLGHATDVPNTIYYQDHERVTEDVGDGGFSVETENFDLAYHPQIDGSRLQEGNLSPFHENNVLESDFGYVGEGYDVIDERERDATDGSWFSTSGRNWVEKSVMLPYAPTTDNVDERLHRPSKALGPPAIGHNAPLRIASSVSVNTRRPQFQEESDASEMDNHKRAIGSTVATKSEVRFMKENNSPTLAFNGNAKPDTTQQQTEETVIPTVLQNTGPPTEDADSRTIFISNVHFAATKDSLSRHFNKFGEVLKVIILTDAATGQPKGSAYIEFMRKEAAELALSLDGTSFMSRLLKIVRKSAAQPDAAASVATWPRIARASSPFPVPRFGRAPFTRGVPNIYRARIPTKPGARNFQWKRGAPDSTAASEPSVQASSSIFPTPTARGLTYVRPEAKANGSSGSS